jgi:hypothetical protein
MSANNFENLDYEFNVDMFNTEDQRYGVEDDNLLLSDPELEEQLNGSSADNNVNNKQEDAQTTEAQPGQPEKKKK